GFGERVELRAMLAQKAPRLVVALADDPEHFGIDGLCRLLAERLRPAITAASAEVGIVARCELYHAECIAHAPTGHHATSKAGGLLDVAFRAGRPRAVDHFFGGAAA